MRAGNKSWATIATILLASAGWSASTDLRLIDAIKHKDRNAAQTLLQQHVDLNAAEADGTTALDWAVHWNDAETVEQLIRGGANVNAANEYGVTALSLACSNANAALVRKLLDAGANANAAQGFGETVLMTCARTGNVEAVKLLLDHKADVNAKTRRGQTALMWAAAEKHADVIQAMIERGADVNAKSHMLEGFKPATYITYGVGYKPPRKPDPVDQQELHPDPSSSKGGFTALFFAAQKGDLESARLLLAAGANINETSPDYGSALLIAAASGQEEFSLFLLDKGADPNVTDSFGFTPLHYALREGIHAINMHRGPMPSDARWFLPNMPSLVKALLAHGANPNARVVKGYPPFNIPAFGRSTGNSMPHLKQPGATPFFLAAASQDPNLMRLLASSGADTKMPTQEGTTPLMVAAGLGRVEDLTPEQEKQALEAVKLALELGADVNAANQDGQTALHGAAYLGANSIIQFLVEKGAHLAPTDKYGQTPLDIALGDPRQLVGADKRYAVGKREHKSAAELLVKLGAPALPPAVKRQTQETGPGIPQ